MHYILDSLKPLLAKAECVGLNSDAINRFAAKLVESQPPEVTDTSAYFLEGNEQQRLAFIVVASTLNFCFWGEPKWGIEVDGKQLGGSLSLMHCLKRAVNSGYPLLDPKYLATLPEQDLQKIFAANAAIPLFKERLQLLHNLGTGLQTQFEGSFLKMLEAGNHQVQSRVELLASAFPTVFADETTFEGVTLRFYKRAQLVPLFLMNMQHAGESSFEVQGESVLTGLADYKVPQMLRRLGTVSYVDSLAKKVDAREEIPAGSREELEIRASTIWAIELLAQKVRELGSALSAIKINDSLWLASQDKATQENPYHLTRTIWY